MDHLTSMLAPIFWSLTSNLIRGICELYDTCRSAMRKLGAGPWAVQANERRNAGIYCPTSIFRLLLESTVYETFSRVHVLMFKSNSMSILDAGQLHKLSIFRSNFLESVHRRPRRQTHAAQTPDGEHLGLKNYTTIILRF